MIDYTDAISEEIKKNREYLGWSQSDLAEKSGLSKYKVHQIEAERAPTVNEFLAIDKALEGNLYWRMTEL